MPVVRGRNPILSFRRPCPVEEDRRQSSRGNLKNVYVGVPTAAT